MGRVIRLGSIHQFQRAPGADVVYGCDGIDVLEIVREVIQESRFERLALVQHPFAHGEEPLLVAEAAGVVGQCKQLRIELAEAGAQRPVQMVEAQHERGIQQPLCARRPAFAQLAAGADTRWRTVPILSDSHRSGSLVSGNPSLCWMGRGCHPWAVAVRP